MVEHTIEHMADGATWGEPTAGWASGALGSMSADRRAVRPAVLSDVSEWAGQELAPALEISSQAAETLLERSLTLVHRLPRTLEALESGALHVGHLPHRDHPVGTAGHHHPPPF